MRSGLAAARALSCGVEKLKLVWDDEDDDDGAVFDLVLDEVGESSVAKATASGVAAVGGGVVAFFAAPQEKAESTAGAMTETAATTSRAC